MPRQKRRLRKRPRENRKSPKSPSNRSAGVGLRKRIITGPTLRSPKSLHRKNGKAPKERPEKKARPTVQATPAPKEPEGQKEALRRGEEQIIYQAEQTLCL